MRYSLLSALLLLGLTSPGRSQTPLLKAPDGFTVELLLQAPDIEAPTALAVAPNGDVYVAEDPMDMGGPPTKNIDRIWLLKGGDPRRKVLFADRMWAVMGLEVVGDKLYVVHPPYVTVFTLDAEGTAKARHDLFTDLGPKVAGEPSFNDHVPSGIRMGMDGWLYVSIGDKGIPKMTRRERGSVEVAEGRWRQSDSGNHISLEGGGVIRFRPDGSGLEVFASGTRNHLDVPLDDHDRIFVRDNTDDGLGWWTRLMYLPPGGFLGYPWAYTQRPQETLPMIRDFGGGSPCGGWVYSDDGLPEAYRGRIFHCEWGQGKVAAVKVAPDGAGFRFVDQIDFLTANGVRDFRPFTLRPAADGRGFYVTDWAFSGWLSKTKAGRLWKVTYTKGDVPPAPRGQDTDSIEQLVKALDHPAHSERLRAQRALEARTDAGLAGALVRRPSMATPRAQRHLLWCLVNRSDAPINDIAVAAARALTGPDAALRAEAARVLGQLRRGKELLRGLEDPEAAVRLCAAAGLARCTWDVEETIRLVEGIVRRPEADRFVRHALVKLLRAQGPGKMILSKAIVEAPPEGASLILEALAQEYRPREVKFLGEALGGRLDPKVREQIVATLGRLYFDRPPYPGTWWGTQPAAQKPPARTVAWEGTPLVRDALLKALADRDTAVRNAAVAALTAANDPATLEPLAARLAAEKEPAARLDLVRAIGGLKTPKIVPVLQGVLADGANAEALRREAVRGLEQVKTPAAATALAAVTTEGQPTALRVRALEALGTLQAKSARSAIQAALASREVAVRRAAVMALGQLGNADAAADLLPLLNDADASVKVAAVQALGALKAKEAIPALVQAAGNEATQFDAVAALARMPDIRALSAYLSGLTSKNAELRQACRSAVAAIRDDAAPVLEQLAKRNEIPAAALAELREVYSSFTPILSWRVIGPFPRDGRSHPPEKEQIFSASYKGAEKEVKWRTISADAAQRGRVDLFARLQPNQQVEAYGYAEIDSTAARDATLLVGSDDTVSVWLNGRKVHEHGGDRGWAPDQDRVSVKLNAGTNRLLVKCANSGGPWDYSVAVSAEADRYAFLKGAPQKHDLEAFRTYARKTRGDAERGARLFGSLKGLACIKCHAVRGEGGQVGPDLAGIALKYKREDLMTSILEPSKVIAQGYETIVITTAKGKTLTGVFKGETGNAVNLADAEGKMHAIPKREIDERSFSPVSMMPNGLSDGMTLEDLADLLAYLEERREQPASKK